MQIDSLAGAMHWLQSTFLYTRMLAGAIAKDDNSNTVHNINNSVQAIRKRYGLPAHGATRQQVRIILLC